MHVCIFVLMKNQQHQSTDMKSATLSSPVCHHPHYNPLSFVLRTAARLIKDLSPRDHITPTLKQLHWLPIHATIAFKISLLMYHIHYGTSPSYMSSSVTPCFASRSIGIRANLGRRTQKLEQPSGFSSSMHISCKI